MTFDVSKTFKRLNMKSFRFLRCSSGNSAVEYGLLIALIALVAMGAIAALGGSVGSSFDKSGEALAQAGSPNGGDDGGSHTGDGGTGDTGGGARGGGPK